MNKNPRPHGLSLPVFNDRDEMSTLEMFGPVMTSEQLLKNWCELVIVLICKKNYSHKHRIQTARQHHSSPIIYYWRKVFAREPNQFSAQSKLYRAVLRSSTQRRPQAPIPLNRSPCLSWSGSDIQLNRSRSSLMLPFIERCAKHIHFTHPVSMMKLVKPNSCLQPSFIQVHRENRCSSGFPVSNFLFNFVIEMVVELSIFTCKHGGVVSCLDRRPVWHGKCGWCFNTEFRSRWCFVAYCRQTARALKRAIHTEDTTRNSRV